MTEGSTIQQDLIALRGELEQARDLPDLHAQFAALSSVLEKIVGLLEGQWSAIRILQADDDEDPMDEVAGPKESEQGTDD